MKWILSTCLLALVVGGCDDDDTDNNPAPTIGDLGAQPDGAVEDGGVDPAALKINEVMARAADDGPDWIELYNPSDTTVVLSGWQLSDDGDEPWLIPEGVEIAAGGFLVFEKDTHFPFGFGAADAAHLLSPDGAVIDATSWADGHAPEGETWGRLPDGAGAFSTLHTPTPGAANVANAAPACGDGHQDEGEGCDDGNTDPGDGCDASCQPESVDPPTSSVMLNEVMPSDIDGGPDWIELFNAGDAQVDLTGWGYHDDDPTHLTLFAEGTIIGVGAYLLLTRDVDFTFGLGGSDLVVFVTPDGEPSDRLVWTDAIDGESWGRLPNGEGDATWLRTPTPGAANVANDAPACGDGHQDEGEGCDDGNTEPGDGCDADCQPEAEAPRCGDGNQDEGEGCDDGNTEPGDGCDADCQPEAPRCGDGNQDEGEGCDDGNTDPGDGCDADCQPDVALSGVIINEVMTADPDGGADWFELYNLSDSPEDLEGWVLTDDNPSHQVVLPAGLSIGAHSYLVLTSGDDFEFGLGADDGLVLYDPFALIWDETYWFDGDIEPGHTWARLPDGRGPFQSSATPTPGEANQP